ncbi:hypothetical protein E8E13_010301 [Curvularia kusanoi]|uniref:Uncharacterized protein n=1 Tax=Curvularia kusanoi TaxID=90978 RepID=A0A9P4TMV3_CURKU|nr:hypothetical protein E8E13_010301 [Curvularia kusanoi]
MQTLIRSTQTARMKSTNFSRLRDAYAGSTLDERSERRRHRKHQGAPAQHATSCSHPAKAQLESAITPPTRLAIRKVQSGWRDPPVLKSKAKDSTTQFHPKGRVEDSQPFPTRPKKPATHQKSREKKPRAQSHSVPIRKVLTIPTEPAAHDTPAPKTPSAPSPSPSPPFIRKISSHPTSSLSLAYLTSQRSKNRLRRGHRRRGKISQSHTIIPIKRTLSRPPPLSTDTAAILARTRLSGKVLARLTTQLCIVTRLDARRLPAFRKWRVSGEADRGAGRRGARRRRTLVRKRWSGGSVLLQKEKRRADGMEHRGARSWQQHDDAGRRMSVRRVRGRMRIRRFLVRERRLDEEIGSWLGGGGSSGGLF